MAAFFFIAITSTTRFYDLIPG